MASFLHFSPVFLTFLPLLLLISPTHSLTCTSQKFPNPNSNYTNCSDLPNLKAYLHWTYDPRNSTISLAFIAPPASPNGWIAWGINPTSTGMLGTHALVALKDAKGALVVKTFNLASYKSIEETSKLSFKVLDSRAVEANGTMTIFAKLELQENMTASLNHVWQVGGSVKNGVPEKHEFSPDNLGSKGTVDLVEGDADGDGDDAPTSAPTGGVSNGPTASGKDTAGVSRLNVGVFGILLSFGIMLTLGL